MKKFAVLVAFAAASASFAQDTASVAIRNICDTLSLGSNPEIELTPSYIEETNWYGNPHTMTKDSSTFALHESYETLSMNYSTSKTMQIPVSIKASCHEMQQTIVGFAKWTTSQNWQYDTVGDYSTYIYDIHALKMNGHDSSNTYNILAYVPGLIPQDYSFDSHQLLFSATFEFAFEWWFASARYQYNKDATHIGVRFGSSASNDSLKAVNAAISVLAVPDSITSVRLQVVKVVLGDSRKPQEPESSSGTVVNSSSSKTPESSSAATSSSSVASSSASESSSSNGVVSSSSEKVSSSSESSSSCESSSSEKLSSSSAEASSSSEAPVSSSAEPESSSAAEPESSSAAESSSSDAESSSSEVESSSSEEGPTRIAVDARSMENASGFVQVRRLDGTVVKNSGTLTPGVYYVKDSRGLWKKMAVLPR